MDTFLHEHQLNDCFHFVSASSKIWGKNRNIRHLIKSRQLNIDNMLYIGDETRDVDAAKKAGIKVAAVTWGFNSGETLKKHNPHYILNHPSELLSLLPLQ